MSKATTRAKGKARAKERQLAARRARNRRGGVLLAGVAVAAVLIFLFVRDKEGATPRTSSAGFTGGDFHSMVVDPQNPKRIFVGGHQAVSVSTDGGKSFRQVESLANRDAMGWGFVGSTIYVSGHPGLTVSADGGETFNEKNEGLPSTDLHSFGVGKGILYAASPAAGFFASTDEAETWRVVNSNRGRSFFGRMLVDSTNPDHLVAADAAAGVAETTDGGKTWRDLGGAQSTTWVSWDPRNPLLLIASGGTGAMRSEDGGTSWSPMDIPSGTSIVELDPTDPNVLYAGSHDGEAVTVQMSRDGGASWNVGR
jgi:photosystem II stability/assembly factor-like uncharacterized protein